MRSAMWSMCAVALLVASLCPAAAEDWSSARSTYYGDQPWLWSIHRGSCEKGYIWPDTSPTGWDVTALPDGQVDCDACFEVQCDPTDLSDSFGQSLGRSDVCYDSSQSVIVQTVDTCPCIKSDNQYSNSRWCCGDQSHFDLSVYAFEKLADKKWGVISIRWRPVPCGTQPSNPAPTPSNPFPAIYPDPGTYRSDFDWGKYFGRGGIDPSNGQFIPLNQFQAQFGR